MGYTHNWQRPTELPADRFADAARDCQKIINLLDTGIAGFDGTGDPVFKDDHIVFNGLAPMACEPFEIRRIEFDRRGRALVCSFCKTEHCPYDLPVRIALIVFAHHCGPSFIVRSNGQEKDWDDARRIVAERCGYGSDFRLKEAS